MTPQMAVLMADYNRVMNERVFDAAAKLDAATLVADQGAFFGSILGTLNHIAVADTIWLRRFAQHEARFASLADLSGYPRPATLRDTVGADFDSLRAYRRSLDELIARWTAELTPAHFATTLSYRSLAGEPATRPFAPVLQHFFNHQTHHRGQVSTLLFQAGVDVGVTDLVAMVQTVAT